eukprot:29268-Pelagococcus_subviridis.AAC.3
MSRDDTHVRSFRLRRRRRLLRSFVRSRAPSHFSRHSSPSAAFEFAVPLASSASCAAATLAASPLHAFKTLDCNARPYENDSAHGFTAGSLGSFHTSDCRGGVQRRQAELKGVEGGD